MLRCKPGDLAFIMREEEPCTGNIGRIVEVIAPAGDDHGWEGWFFWHVRSAGTPLLAVDDDGANPTLETEMDMADAFLLPIQGDSNAEVEHVAQENHA